MNNVGKHCFHRLRRILVGTKEVSDVDERTETLVIHGFDQRFHTVRVLRNVAVILGHGVDAQTLGIFSHPADLGGDLLDDRIKAHSAIGVYHVVTEHGYTHILSKSDQ